MEQIALKGAPPRLQGRHPEQRLAAGDKACEGGKQEGKARRGQQRQGSIPTNKTTREAGQGQHERHGGGVGQTTYSTQLTQDHPK